MTLIDLTRPARTGRRIDALPVAIIGAGPIGLAAAANLIERGIPFELYESGDRVAAGIRSWGHIRLFSPWRHLVDPAVGATARRHELDAAGRRLPPDGK